MLLPHGKQIAGDAERASRPSIIGTRILYTNVITIWATMTFLLKFARNF